MNNLEITSVNNELVKNIVKLQQKKYRDEEKRFLIEGFKAIEEAFKSKIEIEYIFVNKANNVMLNLLTKGTAERMRRVTLSALAQHLIGEQQCDPETSSGRRNGKINLILTTEHVLKKVSTTDSAPEAVAVAKQKIFTIDDIKNSQKVILLENIKDLGNFGTILRTAKAFSQDAIVLYGDTVDLYNPKCVRSAVGNLWKLPVVQIKDFKTLEALFKSFDRVATLPKSKDSIFLKDFNAKSPYLIMFGSEADGLSQELIDFSTQKVTIEMNNEVESLNLSISAGIILYKLTNH